MTTKQEKLDRVTRLRDAAVRLVISDGEWKTASVKGNAVRIRGVDRGQLSILYTTPFQRLPRDFTDREKYIAASNNIRLPTAAAFLLDVWADGRKVLSLAWDDGAPIDIVSYHRGDWESELLG
jgi:hypothetical protein